MTSIRAKRPSEGVVTIVASQHRMDLVTRWFVSVSATAFAVAVICALIPSSWVHWPGINATINAICQIVPSLKAIATRSGDYDRYLLVLASQWPFALLYIYIFFIRLFPFNPFVWRKTEARLAAASASQRPNRMALLLGLALLVLNILATTGIVHWASFYNGGYVLDKESPIYSVFYASKLALVVYAWFSCIMEVIFAWLLLYVLAHFHRFFIAAWPGVNDANSMK
jgi:hypothetical protein